MKKYIDEFSEWAKGILERLFEESDNPLEITYPNYSLSGVNSFMDIRLSREDFDEFFKNPDDICIEEKPQIFSLTSYSCPGLVLEIPKFWKKFNSFEDLFEAIKKDFNKPTDLELMDNSISSENLSTILSCKFGNEGLPSTLYDCHLEPATKEDIQKLL